MQDWKRWIGIGVALGVIAALSPLLSTGPQPQPPANSLLGRLVPSGPAEEPEPDLKGLNLLRFKLHPRRVTTPLRHGRTAELTLDPDLQRSALSVMKRYTIPEAGVVLMDVRSAEVLAYASHIQEGPPVDVNARVEAPAASIFKLVTAAALVEQPGVTAATEQCYRGGQSKIEADQLRDDPQLDRWCASLAVALGRSLNLVFAKLARKHLTPEGLTEKAGAFGFGAPTPFDVPTDVPTVDLPTDPVGFARAAAGFWHTQLSPLAAASIAQTIASGGVTFRPRIVRRVTRGRERELLWEADEAPRVVRRAIDRRPAAELTKMMVQTVASGSAFKAFHDPKGVPFLPHIQVAGKTGTLTRHSSGRHYTWFVGFAPADAPEVAISALVVNTPVWRIKAPLLAREVLRSYFSNAGRKGVTHP